MARAILVSGATGKQGGALIQSLIDQDADFRILALTRDSTSAAAHRLAAKSSKVSLIQGNLEDTEAVFREAETVVPSIWGVFSVTAFTMGGALTEERQGKNLIDSALGHGVQHFVYTSSGRGGDKPTEVPHFVSKHNIEHHLMGAARGTSMKWSILRPVAFMDNLDGGFYGKVFATGWQRTVKSRPLQVVAVEDIGLIGAQVFLSSDRYNGEVIEIAGDELTYAEMVATYKDVKGEEVPTTFGLVISGLFLLSAELRTMFNFFETEGFGTDINETKRVLPELQSFKTWLRRRTLSG